MSKMRKEVIEIELLQDNTARMILPKNLKNGLASRINASRGFIRDACNWFQRNGYKNIKFAVQLHDDEPDVPAFIMDAPSSSKRSTLTLIPDFYCLGSQGYANLRKDFEKLPKWSERIPMSIWRGSITGGGMLTKEKIKTLLRYKLCAEALENVGKLDAKFNEVVQTKSDIDKKDILNMLLKNDMIARRMEPKNMALHQWILNIDGNVNSWGLLWKLLSGSCVIHAESRRQQWFYDRLIPWKNYIPLNSNLDNLIEVIDWCRKNKVECEEVAFQGRRKALEIVRDMKIDQEKAMKVYSNKWL